MKRAFNFSLQKVLDVRSMVEESKAIELQKAKAETEIEKQKLVAVQAEKESLVQGEASSSDERDVTLHELSNRRAYVDQLTDKIKEQGESVSSSEEKAEVHRDEYIKASKDKMVIEKLKEHHQETFRKKLNQDQVKEESELASRMNKTEDAQ